MIENKLTILSRGASKVGRFLPKYLYALLVSPFLFTAGVFSPKHRFLIFQIAKHFGLKMPTEDQRLPVVPLSAVLDRQLDVALLEPLGEGGNATLLELIVISTLARQANPAVAFEIGTFDGRTTLNIAANLPVQGKVFTLDLPKSKLRGTRFELAPGEAAFVDKKMSGAMFVDTELAPKITQLYGDSASFDFSPYQRQMGLVFVDGSHAFEYVRHDAATALQLVAGNDGVILWHDYQQHWPGVIRALNQLYQTDPVFSGLQRIEGTSLVMLKHENSRRPA